MSARLQSLPLRLGMGLLVLPALIVTFASLANLTWGLTGAAAASQPGDLLYPMRVSALQLRLALAPNPDTRAEIERQLRSAAQTATSEPLLAAQPEVQTATVTLPATEDTKAVVTQAPVEQRGPTEAATSTPTDDRDMVRPSPTGTPAPVATNDDHGASTTEPDLTATHAAEPTKTPYPTEKHDPSSTPESTRTPEPSHTLEPSQTAEPSQTLGPSQTLEPSRTMAPSETPQPSRTAEPSWTDEQSQTPESSDIPKPTDEPKSTDETKPPDPTKSTAESEPEVVDFEVPAEAMIGGAWTVARQVVNTTRKSEI